MLKYARRNKPTNHRALTLALLDYSLAEICSGIEMNQAAKRTNQTELATGFIRHALDEYRHANIFNDISKKLSKKYEIENIDRYLTRTAYDKKYIGRYCFLYEKKSAERFSVFVYISESYAAKHFQKIIRKSSVLDKNDINDLNNILKDELQHIKHAEKAASEVKSSNPLLYWWFTIIERENLIRRNCQGKINWLNKCIAHCILYVAIILLRLLRVTIRKKFNRLTFDQNIKLSMDESHEMI